MRKGFDIGTRETEYSFLSDIKMKNYKMKSSFVRPEGSKDRANKSGIKFIIIISIFVENCLSYDAFHDFPVWLGNGPYPPSEDERYHYFTA